MTIINIIDDKDDSVSYKLDEYNISASGNCVLLELTFNDTTVNYEISTDTREPDIEKIKSFISEQLIGETFTISEYLSRKYIFIGVDENRKQFSAHKQ